MSARFYVLSLLGLRFAFRADFTHSKRMLLSGISLLIHPMDTETNLGLVTLRSRASQLPTMQKLSHVARKLRVA
ncbi:hypothetical protein BH18VER1_BH18VER1_07110 [soil metagenome]